MKGSLEKTDTLGKVKKGITTMTIKEKLLEEFGSAIYAIFGDLQEEDSSDYALTASEIDAIAQKVKFYLDLD